MGGATRLFNVYKYIRRDVYIFKMARVIFPENPSEGDFFIVGSTTYMWDGTKWVSTSSAPQNIGATGPTGPSGPIGATGHNGATGPMGASGHNGATGVDGIQGGLGSTGATGADGMGAMCSRYTYSTATNTTTNPGYGAFRFNNTLIVNSTRLTVSDTNRNNADLSNFYNLLTAGSHIYIQNENDADRFVLLELNSDPIDNGDWFLFDDWTIIAQGSAVLKRQSTLCIQVRGPQGIQGPVGATGARGGVDVATLKSIVAASTDFADFQSRIANETF